MHPADVLRRSPLFDRLSDAELRVLAELVRPRAFAAGEALVREGEVGESLLLLAEGEAEVVLGARQVALARLRPPEVVGEMALVDREERSATVRALGPVEALELTAEAFASFRLHSRDGFALVVLAIARLLSKRLRETSAKLAAAR